MRSALPLAVLIFTASCGGPPVGRKIPRPDPAAVAAGAAMAAGAATLADPDRAAKTPEYAKKQAPDKPKRVKETVPGDVLDRTETDEELPPCPPRARKPAKTGGEKRSIELVPVPVTELRDGPPDKSAEPTRCREVDDDDDEGQVGGDAHDRRDE